MLSGFIAASLLIVVLLISAMLFEIVQDTAVSEFASEQLSQPVHPYQTYQDIEAYESGEHGAIKRKDLNIPEDAFVVGMVGRMSPQKAPDVFVKMAKQVKDEVPNAHFIIVGNGNQEDEIRKYAEDNGFSNSLHITGWVDNPMSYVELFDVACLLSRWEGFGLALPEYMMAGKPIVASRVDAIPNIIRNGENGLLVEVDDDIGASNAVLRIYQEKELKDKLVLQGLEDVGFYKHCPFHGRWH